MENRAECGPAPAPMEGAALVGSQRGLGEKTLPLGRASQDRGCAGAILLAHPESGRTGGHGPPPKVARSAGPLNNRYDLIPPLTPALSLVIVLGCYHLLSRLMEGSGLLRRGPKQKLWVAPPAPPPLSGQTVKSAHKSSFFSAQAASPLLSCGCLCLLEPVEPPPPIPRGL